MNQQLLDRVLREALVSLEPAEWLHGEGLEAVGAVARRHRGQEFSQAPVAAELVEAILCLLLGRRRDGSSPWRRMAGAVAETLCDDPVARGRLEALWKRLCEGL